MSDGCPLCLEPGGITLWRDEVCRVVLVDDAAFPGFCRVIWNDHVSEMTDLAVADRVRLMNVVFYLEAAIRRVTGADKINLASLGNVVPHLHWHVIPRWRDDSHFPDPVWANARRAPTARLDVSAVGRLIAAELAKPA